MGDRTQEVARRLEAYRSYLGLLARQHLDPALAPRVDLSAVVQQTLLEACWVLAAQPQGDEAPPAPLLRKLLANNLTDELRKALAQRRDAGRERSLEAALQQSSARLGRFLAADQSSPSLRAQREEDLARMAVALEALPEPQRVAVEMHYLRGLSLEAIAQAIGRSKPAVAGLLHRALDALREELTPRENAP
jgi:RNA polymerase sigma-70 factor (ECF subfamily)